VCVTREMLTLSVRPLLIQRDGLIALHAVQYLPSKMMSGGADVKLTGFVRPAGRPPKNERCRLIKLDFTRVGGCCRGAVGTFRPRAECVIYLRLLPGLKRFISFCASTAPKIQTVENLLPLQKTQPGMCSA